MILCLLATVFAIELEFPFMSKMINIPSDTISPTETETFQTSRVPIKGAI